MTDVLIKRELLERLACEVIPKTHQEMLDASEDFGAAIKELRAILAAPRQPDGKGLEVWGNKYRVNFMGQEFLCSDPKGRIVLETIPLCRLSDAQRAIAELTDRNTKLCATINRMVAEGVLICDERDTLRQQLAERDAEIERGAIERSELRKQIAERDMEILAKDISECKALGDRNKAREQRDKLAAALERIADTDPDAGTAWFHEVADAALAEVNK